MRRLIRRPSAATAVACIALLVALSGTSYATVLNVPKNSVGTPQLKRNAVKPAKLAPNAVRTAHVLNGSLLAVDFKAGQLPSGPKGDRGRKGGKGDAGPAGQPGVSGLQIVQATSSGTSADEKAVEVNCPAGKRVLGGGGLVASGAPLVLTKSYPTASSWVAAARETSAYAGAWGGHRVRGLRHRLVAEIHHSVQAGCLSPENVESRAQHESPELARPPTSGSRFTVCGSRGGLLVVCSHVLEEALDALPPDALPSGNVGEAGGPRRDSRSRIELAFSSSAARRPPTMSVPAVPDSVAARVAAPPADLA